jgi:hypothetical protein
LREQGKFFLSQITFAALRLCNEKLPGSKAKKNGSGAIMKDKATHL